MQDKNSPETLTCIESSFVTCQIKTVLGSRPIWQWKYLLEPSLRIFFRSRSVRSSQFLITTWGAWQWIYPALKRMWHCAVMKYWVIVSRIGLDAGVVAGKFSVRVSGDCECNILPWQLKKLRKNSFGFALVHSCSNRNMGLLLRTLHKYHEMQKFQLCSSKCNDTQNTTNRNTVKDYWAIFIFHLHVKL